jgi:hypothetical protein
MKLAASPKCFMGQLARESTMTVFDWIEMAAGHVEDSVDYSILSQGVVGKGVNDYSRLGGIPPGHDAGLGAANL